LYVTYLTSSQNHTLTTHQALGEQIDRVRSHNPADREENIFHALLESDLPEAEKSNRRLVDEAVTVVGAGSHTVAWAVSVGSCYILSNPSILRNLKNELKTVDLSGGNEQLLLSQLEKLPYLTGVVKESLRLSHGVSLRLPRIAPMQEMRYKDWIIPAGTSVGMTAALMHLDPNNFSDPDTFKPERWVEDTDGRLDKYLNPFGGGGRICLGINLAWAELHLIIAGFFGKFGGIGSKGEKEWRLEGEKGVLELFGTDVGDVRICGDNFFPLVKEGSLGVRVLIKS
jgi:cytochrome P450